MTRPRFRTLALASAVLTVAAGVAAATMLPAQARQTAGGETVRYTHSCATALRGNAVCHAVQRTDLAPMSSAQVSPDATPAGLGPKDIQSAYKLPSATAGSGHTVAIVDAFDDPTAEADLGVYRRQFGLSACTTANGCFRKLNQNGKASPLPRKNAGWAQEISLDVDMVSATCPRCKIVLVEANSASFADLGAAVNTAARLGVDAISNSYGGPDAADSSFGHFYNHPGIAITVSSGDGGFGVEYPASSHFVTAVGGTSLRKASGSRGWSESAWSGAGSGCSSLNARLTGQASAGTGCSRRAVADVSAVADPATGVAVFDSTPAGGSSAWLVFGGTSVSAPVIASVYALAGNAHSIDNNFPYAHTSSLFDITSGSNGSCATTQQCHARKGWDGPTGLGTPNGVGAF